MRKALLMVSCLAMAALFVSPALATTAVKLSTEEMALQADRVLEGTCIQTRSAWHGRALVTVATLEVKDTLKGAQTQLVEVVLPGGIDSSRTPGVQMIYPGAPTLRPDEEAILFLANYPQQKDAFMVLGYSQGKYDIVTDPDGHRLVHRDLTDLSLLSSEGVELGTKSQSMEVTDFKQKIRSILESAPGAQR